MRLFLRTHEGPAPASLTKLVGNPLITIARSVDRIGDAVQPAIEDDLFDAAVGDDLEPKKQESDNHQARQRTSRLPNPARGSG